jgi:hypothetical protein
MINQELHTDEGTRGEESSAAATHIVCLKGKKKEKSLHGRPAHFFAHPPPLLFLYKCVTEKRPASTLLDRVGMYQELKIHFDSIPHNLIRKSKNGPGLLFLFPTQ